MTDKQIETLVELTAIKAAKETVCAFIEQQKELRDKETQLTQQNFMLAIKAHADTCSAKKRIGVIATVCTAIGTGLGAAGQWLFGK